MTGTTFPRLDDDQHHEQDQRLQLDPEQFLRDILPTSGRYCIATKPQGQQKFWQLHWFDTISDLAGGIARMGDRMGVYYGTASFGDLLRVTKRGKSYPGDYARKQANVTGRKCFHLDLDAGAEKLAKHGPEKVYATRAAAQYALHRFANDTGLFPTYTVSSGEGLHAYWCLSETITRDEWDRRAALFSKLIDERGLKQDHACTTDSSRILRPLATMHENGKPVEVLASTGKFYTLEQFDADLERLAGGEGLSDAAPAAAPGRKRTGINNDVLASDTAPGRNDTPHDFAEIRSRCAALNRVATARGNVEEPLWRAMLGVLKFCKDGETLAHDLSAGHPEYDQGETQEKFDRWEAGPTTCNEFAGYCGAECKACPQRGKITSPIQLDREHQRQQPRLIQQDGGTVRPNGAALREHLPDWHCKEGQDGALMKTRPMNTTGNIAALARLVGVKLRQNVMTRRAEIQHPGLRMARDDYDNAALAYFGDAVVRAGLTRDGLAELTDAVAGDNPYHPALEWIESAPWDGLSRRAEFHASFVLTDQRKAELSRKLIDAFMLQGIGALVEQYGISAQGVLVLAGPQGCNKTRKVSNLCPLPGAVITGLHIDPTNKDHVLQATSAWISECGELETTTRKADVGAFKAFITRDVDVIRPPYAKRENSYKRRTVFIGTVNGTGFLVDETGNRRFWVIEVERCELLPDDTMQQVWAEYLHLYQQGERWHLDRETQAELNDSNLDHTAVDPLYERIATAFDWSSVDWAKVTKHDPTTWAGVAWMTATDICRLLDLGEGRRVATMAGTVVTELRRRGVSQGGSVEGVSPNPRVDQIKVVRGLKLHAVPEKRSWRI